MLEFRLLIIRSIEPIFKQTVETVVPKKVTILRVPTVAIADCGDRSCCDGSLYLTF
jgi:hypothetical protein